MDHMCTACAHKESKFYVYCGVETFRFHAWSIHSNPLKPIIVSRYQLNKSVSDRPAWASHQHLETECCKSHRCLLLYKILEPRARARNRAYSELN